MNVSNIKQELQRLGVSSVTPGLYGDDRYEELKTRLENAQRDTPTVSMPSHTTEPTAVKQLTNDSTGGLSIGELRSRLTALGLSTQTPGLTGDERWTELQKRLMQGICGNDSPSKIVDDIIAPIVERSKVRRPPDELPPDDFHAPITVANFDPIPQQPQPPVEVRTAESEADAGTALENVAQTEINELKKNIKRVSNKRSIYVASLLSGTQQDEEMKQLTNTLSDLETDLLLCKSLQQRGESKVRADLLKSRSSHSAHLFVKDLLEQLEFRRDDVKEELKRRRAEIREMGDQHAEFGLHIEERLKQQMSAATLQNSRVSRARRRIAESKVIDEAIAESVPAPVVDPPNSRNDAQSVSTLNSASDDKAASTTPAAATTEFHSSFLQRHNILDDKPAIRHLNSIASVSSTSKPNEKSAGSLHNSLAVEKPLVTSAKHTSSGLFDYASPLELRPTTRESQQRISSSGPSAAKSSWSMPRPVPPSKPPPRQLRSSNSDSENTDDDDEDDDEDESDDEEEEEEQDDDLRSADGDQIRNDNDTHSEVSARSDAANPSDSKALRRPATGKMSNNSFNPQSSAHLVVEDEKEDLTSIQPVNANHRQTSLVDSAAATRANTAANRNIAFLDEDIDYIPSHQSPKSDSVMQHQDSQPALASCESDNFRMIDNDQAEEQEQIRTLRDHAHMLEKLDDNLAAEVLHERALELDPTDIQTLTRFAVFLHSKKGELARAEAFFNRALQLCLPKLHSQIQSPAKQNAKNINAPTKVSPKAINSQTENESAKPRLALKDRDDAKFRLHDVVALLLSFADFLEKAKGDPEGAASLLRTAVAMAPSNATTLATLAHFFTLHQDLSLQEDSDAMFQKALRLEPKNATFMMWYGKYLKKRKRLGPAELMYRSAVDVSKGDKKLEPAALCNYATFLFKHRKNIEQARDMFEASMTRFPDHKGLRKNFGHLHKWLQKHKADGSEENPLPMDLADNPAASPSQRKRELRDTPSSSCGRGSRRAQRLTHSIVHDIPVTLETSDSRSQFIVSQLQLLRGQCEDSADMSLSSSLHVVRDLNFSKDITNSRQRQRQQQPSTVERQTSLPHLMANNASRSSSNDDQEDNQVKKPTTDVNDLSSIRAVDVGDDDEAADYGDYQVIDQALLVHQTSSMRFNTEGDNDDGQAESRKR